MVIHSDSPDRSAIARTEHSGADSGQGRAKSIQKTIVDILLREDPPMWCGSKAMQGFLGMREQMRSQVRLLKKTAWPTASLARLKLRISEEFRTAKEEWHKDPHHHGTEEIAPPSPQEVSTVQETL
jgi:hypothetical protein